MSFFDGFNSILACVFAAPCDIDNCVFGIKQFWELVSYAWVSAGYNDDLHEWAQAASVGVNQRLHAEMPSFAEIFWLTFPERSPKLFSVKVGFGGKPCVKILPSRLNMVNKIETELRVLMSYRARRTERFKGEALCWEVQTDSYMLAQNNKIMEKNWGVSWNSASATSLYQLPQASGYLKAGIYQTISTQFLNYAHRNGANIPRFAQCPRCRQFD